MSIQAANYLFKNRLEKNVVINIPDTLYPESVATAYETQRILVKQLMEAHDSKPCGYKLACTNVMAMELLGIEESFSGRLMSHSTHKNGISLLASDFTQRVVETEFMFEIATDIPISNKDYTLETVRPFIGDHIASLEVVDHRFSDFSKVGGPALVADNAIHGGSILGDRSRVWQSLDLANHKVSLLVNDSIFAEGTGENVLGNPLNGMAWLANHLAKSGEQLKSGDIVTTGTACAVYNAQVGDHFIGDFGILGTVEAKFI